VSLRRALICGALMTLTAISIAATGTAWCLRLGSLGPVRTGMTVEQVLRLAGFSGMERRPPAGEWLSEGTHFLVIEKHRMRLLREVQNFLDES